MWAWYTIRTEPWPDSVILHLTLNIQLQHQKCQECFSKRNWWQMQCLQLGNSYQCKFWFSKHLTFRAISTLPLQKTVGQTWRKLLSFLKKSFFHSFKKPKQTSLPQTANVSSYHGHFYFIFIKIMRFWRSCVQNIFVRLWLFRTI